MTARFSEQKSLVLAYSNLLEMGVPAEAMQVHFDEASGVPQPPGEHHSLLERLQIWVREHHGATRSQGRVNTEPPSSPLFESSGGTLEVKAPKDEAGVLAIIVQHAGELVT